MPDIWKSVDTLPFLEDGEVQVWRLLLDDHYSLLDSCIPFLTTEERQLVARRRAGRVREEFAAARACLRVLVGSVLAVEPVNVLFSEGPYGKPATSMNGRSISFNVTHSHGMILIALSRTGDIGIDVEHLDRPVDIMEVAESAFHPDEVELLRSIDFHESRRLAFYRCWTQKEAIIKADGRGLSLPLSSFKVPVLALTDLPVEVDIEGTSGEQHKRYILSNIPLDDPIVGALATELHNCRMNWLNFPLSALERHL